ncbi:hypothetical protein D9615_005878 [Tricholomella constricta]|uniref:Ankyrin repeat protein n=1 Tax=Tricholomella constricta TaxID=117010 RepID=A0A8H5H9J3_9AGAR|nr:hypothetical protein D9615_005878 [Tricholomella constricta]
MSASPAEILAGFDIDAPCCLYNGQRVLAKPRAIVAMMRQANTVDMTRRSPSYEIRLAKYSRRAFEVYVPTLERDNVDPTIYERSIARIQGLARLLVLEKLANTDVRFDFLESRRSLRGKPVPLHGHHKRKRMYKGDLKADAFIGGLEMNDYDVATLHIPYGPGWDARRIDKLVYQTLRSTPRTKTVDFIVTQPSSALWKSASRTVASTVQDRLTPTSENYSKGRTKRISEAELPPVIRFIEEDPGRQSMTGSFNPIDVGEWSAQLYIGKTEHFFGAIVAQDTEAVSKMIKSEIDVNRRDHVGRTALHVAILTGATDIACALIDAGARITARLVDGRSALHLAAQSDQPEVIRRLFEKCASNKATAGRIKPEEKMDVDTPAVGRPSSEDDWTSADDGVISMDTDEDMGDGEAGDDEDDGDEDEDNDENSEEGADNDGDNDGEGRRIRKEVSENAEEGTQDFPEDLTNQPDILEVDLPDWVLGFTPLAHAVMSGSLAGIEELLEEGADVTVLLNTTRNTAFYPLTLTILREDEDEACKILERLISAGASTSMADEHMRTIFHRAVSTNKIKLVSTILKCDPNADSVLNFPCFNWRSVVFPVVIAIDRRHYSMLATLLAHGAKIVFSEEDVARALEATPQKKQRQLFPYGTNHAINEVFLPVESALARRDDVAQLLIALDADINIGLRESLMHIAQPSRRRTIIDWVRFGINFLSKEISSFQGLLNSPLPTEVTENLAATGWKKHLADLVKDDKVTSNETLGQGICDDEQLRKYQDSHSYLVDLERVLVAHGAKAWNDIYPDMPSEVEKEVVNQQFYPRNTAPLSRYSILGKNRYKDYIPQHLCPLYDELFEACFIGDNKKIEQLCLPQEKSKNTTPLTIFVVVVHEKSWAETGDYTPLFAAVRGRRWATAKLIMAIAIAQYKPPEDEEKFSTRGVKIYDEDSDSDDGSEDSDDTIGHEEITFIDIAKRPSVVEIDVHPRKMLDQAVIFWYTKSPDAKKKEKIRGNLLHKAIYDDDLEMFTNIASLYNAAPLPIPIGVHDIVMLLRYDRAEMLDVYIRRTGFGIDIDVKQEEEEDQGVIGVTARNDKDRVYLGLTVHGKKRADLAKMNDPDARANDADTQRFAHCLLWRAAEERATAIVEYLAGDRPLAAYRHYATTGGDERAYQLRRIPDLEKVLPQWLGWTISNLGDSPLMAAVIGGSLDLIKALFAKKPKFMASCLHESVKFTAYNALMLAVDKGCDKDIIDYLLAKSISPAVNDSVRGSRDARWNIYHILCSRNFADLIEHLLAKLPRDVNEALLAQRSKERFNTPLHLAVKRGATRTVKLIVDFTKSTLLMRDLDGSTPLHCAIQESFAEITGTIISAAPPEALYMENGVGETPLDMASLRHKLKLTRWLADDEIRDASSLRVRYADESPRRIELGKLEHELPKLRSTIKQLVADGKLVQGTKLAEELSRFAEMMDAKVVAEKAAEEARPVAAVAVEEDRNRREVCDEKRTMEVVSAAVAAAPGTRLLVHLLDVQKSVHGNMARYAKENEEKKEQDDGEGLGKEEDSESEERRGSLVLSRIQVDPDSY